MPGMPSPSQGQQMQPGPGAPISGQMPGAQSGGQQMQGAPIQMPGAGGQMPGAPIQMPGAQSVGQQMPGAPMSGGQHMPAPMSSMQGAPMPGPGQHAKMTAPMHVPMFQLPPGFASSPSQHVFMYPGQVCKPPPPHQMPTSTELNFRA